MPSGGNMGGNSGSHSLSNFITTHQTAGLIALAALLFLVAVERGFRGLKIDIS